MYRFMDGENAVSSTETSFDVWVEGSDDAVYDKDRMVDVGYVRSSALAKDSWYEELVLTLTETFSCGFAEASEVVVDHGGSDSDAPDHSFNDVRDALPSSALQRRTRSRGSVESVSTSSTSHVTLEPQFAFDECIQDSDRLATTLTDVVSIDMVEEGQTAIAKREYRKYRGIIAPYSAAATKELVEQELVRRTITESVAYYEYDLDIDVQERGTSMGFITRETHGTQMSRLPSTASPELVEKNTLQDAGSSIDLAPSNNNRERFRGEPGPLASPHHKLSSRIL